MKRYLLLPAFLLFCSFLFSGCDLFKKDQDPQPAPKAVVPENLAKKWLYGNFSMTEFWTTTGAHVGNAFELAVAFDFKPDGTTEFYFISGATNFGCRTEAFVWKKGTVEFSPTGNSFTFLPTEGSARGYYTCGSHQNYNNKYTQEQLKPETYYYTIEPDSQGKDQLLLRFNPGDQNVSYFRQVNW
jgi:hypothetical protein